METNQSQILPKSKSSEKDHIAVSSLPNESNNIAIISAKDSEENNIDIKASKSFSAEKLIAPTIFTNENKINNANINQKENNSLPVLDKDKDKPPETTDKIRNIDTFDLRNHDYTAELLLDEGKKGILYQIILDMFLYYDQFKTIIEVLREPDNQKYVHAGIITISFILLVLLCSTLFNIICILVTIYEAMKNIAYNHNNNIKLILILMTLLSILDLVEYLLFFLTTIIPFYYFLKLVFVCWLLFPDLRGLSLAYSYCLFYFFTDDDSNKSCKYKIKEFFVAYDKKYASISTINNS